MKKLVSVLFFPLFFFSCIKKESTINYFVSKQNLLPVQETKYLCSETQQKQIWQRFKISDSTFKTKRLDHINKFTDEIIETISSKGILVNSYQFNIDGQEFPLKTNTYLKEKFLIKWDINKTAKYSGEFVYNGLIFNFIRIRDFYKKHKDTLIFKDQFSITPIKHFQKEFNPFEKQNFIQFSYFKKNEGLVKYKRIFKNNTFNFKKMN